MPGVLTMISAVATLTPPKRFASRERPGVDLEDYWGLMIAVQGVRKMRMIPSRATVCFVSVAFAMGAGPVLGQASDTQLACQVSADGKSISAVATDSLTLQKASDNCAFTCDFTTTLGTTGQFECQGSRTKKGKSQRAVCSIESETPIFKSATRAKADCGLTAVKSSE